MLSSENPSCSSKDSDLASGHEDHQAQPPNFSIRNYVFKSRSKDIRTNWPFHEQLLQLCLDNGINDLLPPFQPPNLVRAHCLKKEVQSVHLPKCVENKTAFENGESEENVVLEFELKQSDQSDINASSTTHDLNERISGEQLKKKCKVRSSEEINMLEDLVSNSIVVSDPMASKVCPVCILFTSSSNTTLNAHIDQCLSSNQSNATRDATEFLKPKVKPRKKRLMVDIYTTAPRCTLEDLDRRNGTNWAATLAPVTPANDICLETERTNIAPLPSENDINSESKRARFVNLDVVSEGKVGDIYVDSNGTKILILSKSSDSSPLVSRKNFKPKKYVKGLKESQSCSNITKKKILKPKFSEFIINNAQRKKLRMCRGFKGENEAATPVDHIANNQEKEESMSQLLNPHDQVKNSELSTLGHWVCSKRSDLSRKLDNKGINKGSEKMTVATRNLSHKGPKPNLDHSTFKRSHSLNFPSSSMASPITRGTNVTRVMDKGKKDFPQTSKLDSKSLEGDYLSPNESLQRESSISKRQRILLKGMDADKLITLKKFKKQRSILGCSKWRGEKTSVNGGIDGSFEDSGLISSRDDEKCDTHHSEFYENQEIENMNIRDPMNNAILTPALDPSLEEDVGSISRDQTEEEIESICRDQNEQEDEESISRGPNEEEDEVSICRDQNVEEDEGSSSRDQNEEEDEESISRDQTEEEIESISRDQKKEEAETSTYNQELQFGNMVNIEVISRDTQIAGNESEQTLQHRELQTDISSFQEPNPCLPSDGDRGVDNTLQNSSTSFIRVESCQDHNMIVDMESSGSAVSTISTISPRSPMVDRINSKTDQVAEFTPVQDNLSSQTMRKEPSCSCSKTLSLESQFSNPSRNNKISNLFIKPPALPSFQICPSLDLHSESVITTDSTKSAMNISTPRSGAQSASSPILRLMGKDLVVNKEEPMTLPKILPCASSYNQETKFISFGYPYNGGFINYNNQYHYPMQSMSNHQIMPMPLHSYPMPTMNSNRAQEVIVIDDGPEPRASFTNMSQTIQNPNLMAPQRFYACFPSQNPYASRATSRREASEGAFMIPSPSSLYFSPSLR